MADRMIELLPALDGWRAQGVDAGRGIVVRTYGSAPRPEGSVLLVADDGRITGSVSGGCVEAAVAEEVQRAHHSGGRRVVSFGVTDEQAWGVGLACGGTIDVLVEPSIRPEVEAAARSLGRAIAVELSHEGASATDTVVGQLVIGEDGSIEGSSGDRDMDERIATVASGLLDQARSGVVEVAGRSWFVESFARRPRLVIVGAIQVAIPLVVMARALGYETVVIDARGAFATDERFPDVDRLIVGWPDEIADEISLGPADAVAFLTHDPKVDEPGIVTALERGCRYVGAIGSRRTQADRRIRLRALGVTEEDLSRLRGPIGLDLGGRQPAETALAIMAEVVASRYGASGTPLGELDRAPATVR